MRIRVGIFLITLAIVAGATGCAAPPTPNPDGPRLVGFDSLPKALATVMLSPTPGPTEVQATLDSRRPTVVPAPATRTPTRTPIVGRFMGDVTPLPGTVVYHGGRIALAMVPGAVVPATPGLITPGAAVSPGAVASGLPGTPGVSGSPPAACPVAPAAPFVNASINPTIRGRLGCPTASPSTIKVVVQPFQNGVMFWRDTREIYALSTAAIKAQKAQSDQFWRFPDNWTDKLPADDPNLKPPPGTFQPVRAFGYVWRNNAGVKDALGWALAGEQVIDSTWQNHERGWMMTGLNGVVFAIALTDPSSGVHFSGLTQ